MKEFATEAHAIKSAIDNQIAPPPGEVFDIASMGASTAVTFLNQIRPRLYAISAVFGNMILNYSEQDRHQIPHDEAINPTTLLELGISVSQVTLGAQTEFFGARREQAHFEAWYQEAERLVGYFRESPEPFYGNYDSPESFMSGGIDTAIDNSVRTLDLVDQAHKMHAPAASDEEFYETARRAKRIPYRIARTISFETLPQVLASLGDVRWNNMVEIAAAYKLERFNVSSSPRNPNILNIKFNDETLTDPSEPSRELDSIEVKLGHLGCPGLVDFSTAEDPFTHSVDRLYLDLLRSAAELRLWRSDKSLPHTRFIDC
jgi:hypothetical protein